MRKFGSEKFKLLIATSLILTVYVIWGTYPAKDVNQRFLMKEVTNSNPNSKSSSCKDGEALPEGIIVRTSDLKMQRLWSDGLNDINMNAPKNLLAVAAGIKQKKLVDLMVRKFLLRDFSVMIFHYDGNVDQWKDLKWSNGVIHVSAVNQTKWWFAKRFLHPDIVAEYEHIFLWDEDLGLENFDPIRYLAIVKEEGLEISQPALDPSRSTVNHRITARIRKSRIHRRVYSFKQRRWCVSNAPPCTGWVEMMAPVFSRSAWRCTWYMIQNDLSYAWGLDMKLGHCAQGDWTKKVGIVDEEYIVHLGLPTLGGTADAKSPAQQGSASTRELVRNKSRDELRIFNNRWKRAVKEDKCWTHLNQNAS